jgi:hypothetical protein
MIKILKFATKEKYLVGLKPIRNYIPEWYKKTDRFFGKKQILGSNGEGAKTLKLCAPFLDTMTTGYTVELWQDVQVRIDNTGEPVMLWGGEPDVAERRPSLVIGDMPIPSGYSHEPFAWKFPFTIKTPKGYSLLMSHPLNRYDLPFLTLSGIVDSDATLSPGNLPFFIKKGFEGIIPKGTPIIQIIPFKRDDWKAEEDQTLVEEGNKQTTLGLRVAFGHYKNNAWKKKTYN